MATTPILQLNSIDLSDPAYDPRSYPARVDFDAALDTSLAAVDTFAGRLTASFCTRFYLTASLPEAITVAPPIGVDYASGPRILQEVVAFAFRSGSGAGVTVFDVKMTDGAGTFNSVFSNLAFRPALSNSLGDYGVARANVFRTASWDPGRIIRLDVLGTTGGTGLGAQAGVNVLVFWKPSGSYGA